MVLVTNVIDEVNAHQVEQLPDALVGRHLPLGVLLRDQASSTPPPSRQPTTASLYRAAAADDILLGAPAS